MLDRWLCWGWKSHKWGKWFPTYPESPKLRKVCSTCGFMKETYYPSGW